jgi:hypothetical protein
MFLMLINFTSYAVNEWTFIGKTANGNSVFATKADGMPDGSWRMFLKAEQEMERKPEGLFAIFKNPEKYIETQGPFSVLVHCKKNSVRDYKAGTFGSEFYIPWEPITPGSYGSVAFNAFCKK